MPEDDPKAPVEKNLTEETLKHDGTTIHVKVYAPFKVYYDGPAQSISAVNETGPFDVLPLHKNFMTLISPCEIIIRKAEGEPEKIKIARGIMHVKADAVVVFLDV